MRKGSPGSRLCGARTEPNRQRGGSFFVQRKKRLVAARRFGTDWWLQSISSQHTKNYITDSKFCKENPPAYCVAAGSAARITARGSSHGPSVWLAPVLRALTAEGGLDGRGTSPPLGGPGSLGTGRYTGFTVPASGSIRKRHVCRLLRLFPYRKTAVLVSPFAFAFTVNAILMESISVLSPFGQRF